MAGGREGRRPLNANIGQVVQLEAVQARRGDPPAIDEAAVETIELNFAGAMACVVVTSTTPRGEIITYTETLLPTPGWGLGAAAPRSRPFGAKAAALDTATLHFTYFVRY